MPSGSLNHATRAPRGGDQDSVLVLLEALEALERHSRAGQRPDGRRDVPHAPTEDGVDADGTYVWQGVTWLYET